MKYTTFSKFVLPYYVVGIAMFIFAGIAFIETVVGAVYVTSQPEQTGIVCKTTNDVSIGDKSLRMRMECLDNKHVAYQKRFVIEHVNKPAVNVTCTTYQMTDEMTCEDK